MNSPLDEPDYDRAAELAKAMRAGLDEMRSTPVTLGAQSPSSAITDLAAYADLRSLPPLAKRGRVTWRIVRAARSLLRALQRPWLAVQTEFNQGVMAELNDLRRRIAMLEKSSLMPAALQEQQDHIARQDYELAAGEPSGAMPVALHRHESDQDRAIA
jgi:hypothetical protein